MAKMKLKFGYFYVFAFNRALTDQRHDRMMKHVQQRDLIVLFAQHEKGGVEQIGKFGSKVHPAEVDEEKIDEGRLAIDRTAVPRASDAGCDPQAAQKAEPIEADHQRVVNQYDRTQIERFSMAHPPGAEHFDEQQISADHRQHGPRATLHERHRLNASIAVLVPRIVQQPRERRSYAGRHFDLQMAALHSNRKASRAVRK